MANPIHVIVNYVRSSVAEMKKVTWPTQQTTWRYSALVVAVSVGVALFFAALDFGFSRGITYIIAQGSGSRAQTQETPIVPDLDSSMIDIETLPVEGTEASTDVEPSTIEIEGEPSFIGEEGDALDLPSAQ
jgi:preprotein translocase SecE subunit